MDARAPWGRGAVAVSETPARGTRGIFGLPRNVRVLAAVSFLTDVASEMIYPLLPLFLSTVLGVGAATLGAIEGAAETMSSLLRIPAGWWSDRVKRRKPLMVIGYAIASVVRPLIAFAQGAGAVLAIRLSDRFGKGLRTAPRDALIADAVDDTRRGAAFGFHRAADHLGAVLGPIIAWMLLSGAGLELRTVFLVAAIPGALALAFAMFGVREEKPAPIPPAPAAASPATPRTPLGAPLRNYLLVLFLFALGMSTDAFLLLRASELGVATALIPLLWSAHHLVKSLSSYLLGSLSDRLGRRPVILGGWALYALVYLGFAFAVNAWQVWGLFLVYGVFFGATEGTEKALVADLAPADRRGLAFGWFNAVSGLAALPASVGFGWVWQRFGPEWAFGMGAAIAGAATLLFVLVVESRVGRVMQGRGATHA